MIRIRFEVLILTSILLCSASSFAQSAKDIAVVLKATGDVRVNRAAAQAPEKAGRGTRLNSGNVLRTGEESSAAMVFTDDKSILKVRANSKVNIAGEREESSILKTIKLEFGQLWAKVTRSSTPFRIETPSGVAAVKGTVFYVLSDAKGGTIVFCLEGAIELANKLGKVLVNAGQTGTMNDKSPPTSRPSNPNEVPKWGDEQGEGGSFEIEFQDADGQKKRLKLEY
ncbi:MAG: FecR family protein [bacterium]